MYEWCINYHCLYRLVREVCRIAARTRTPLKSASLKEWCLLTLYTREVAQHKQPNMMITNEIENKNSTFRNEDRDFYSGKKGISLCILFLLRLLFAMRETKLTFSFFFFASFFPLPVKNGLDVLGPATTRVTFGSRLHEDPKTDPTLRVWQISFALSSQDIEQKFL